MAMIAMRDEALLASERHSRIALRRWHSPQPASKALLNGTDPAKTNASRDSLHLGLALANGRKQIVFHIAFSIVTLYVIVRFVQPLPIHWLFRAALALAVIGVGKQHQISRWIWGDMFSPELPYVLMLIKGWGLGVVLVIFLLALLSDVGSVVRYLLLRRWWDRSTALKMRAVVAACAIAISSIGTYHANATPNVRHLVLELPQLPRSMHGYRLVHLSDLHLSRLLGSEWSARVVSRTNELHPDAIVITGDLIDGSARSRSHEVEPLAHLVAHDGVYASLGNHEYYFGAREWMQKLESLGMRVLVNANTAIWRNQDRIVIAGLADEQAGAEGMDGPDLRRALAGVAPMEFTILLKHRPEGASRSQANGVDLQLSGHTHGGMIRGFDQLVAKANEGFVRGLYDVGGMPLNVSAGTGLWNGFALRLGVPSEIVLIELRPTRDGGE